MKFYKFLNEEDIIKKAMDLPEPEIGGSYPEEKVQRYIEMIDKALSAMENKEENDANDAIVQDLRDKKKKWSNVDKETKPVKIKQEEPPMDQQQEEPPVNQQQESTIKRVLEGKMRLGKKDSKAMNITNHINAWPDWYYSDVPQKKLVKELMDKFKIDNKKALNILKIKYWFKEGRINLGDFQDYTHMILQGENIKSL
jgi:hypothetical protein